MPLRTASTGDRDNDYLRKFLENESQVIGSSLTFTRRDSTGTTAVPRYYQTGDYNNTILRKILENQALVIGGGLSYNIR